MKVLESISYKIFHPDRDIAVKVRFTEEALSFSGKSADSGFSWLGRLGNKRKIKATGETMLTEGVDLGKLASCGAYYYELK